MDFEGVVCSDSNNPSTGLHETSESRAQETMNSQSSRKQTMRPTGLRQPRAGGIPRPGFSASTSQASGLHEMSESQSNIRSQIAQPTVGSKRGLPTASQPDAKRQTLAERAGDFSRSAASASIQSSRSIKPVSIKEMGKSTASYRSGGIPTSRTMTNTSTYGNASTTRPPSRSQHARSRSNTRNINMPQIARPTTSMGIRDREEPKTQNGMLPPPRPSTSTDSTCSCSPGHENSTQCLLEQLSATSSEPRNETVLCSKFALVTIRDHAGKEDQVIPRSKATSDVPTRSASQSRHVVASAGSRIRPPSRSLRKAPSCAELRNQDRTQAASMTPGRKAMQERFVEFETNLRPSLTTVTNGSASSSPTKASFLTKYSNTTGFIATDIDEKLGRFDDEFTRIKEFMDSTAVNKDRLEEELDTTKRRAVQLEARKAELQDDLDDARRELKNANREIDYLTEDIRKLKQNHEDEYDNIRRKFSRELDEERRALAAEQDKNNDLLREFEEKCGRDAEAQKEQMEREILEQKARVNTLRLEKDVELQQLNFLIQEREAKLRRAEDDLDKARDQINDNERSIARLNAKIEQLEENAKSLQEAYGSSENRKDHQISDLSRQLQELTRRAEAAERAAEEEKKAAKRAIEASHEDFERMTVQVKQKLIREEEKRHKLFEQVQDLKGNIRVMCRIRPAGASPELVDFDYFESEYDEDKYGGLVVPTERVNALDSDQKVVGKTQPFNFERIFDPSCTNKDVFDEIGQLVQSVMDGKKVCIFCYGQTGSGKTYTMSNQRLGANGEIDEGIIPRAKAMIFDEVLRMRELGWEYSLEGSYLEVYKNKLYDLVAPRNSEPKALQIIRTSDELDIRDHDFIALNSEDDLDFLVQQAEANRHTAETNMNRASSRSHSVLVIKVHGKKTMPDGKVKTREGTLNLIDLAGSESIGRSGATGDVAEEGKQINMSLTHLGTVLKKLGEGTKKESVDFSSFTLTQLLKPSLGEKCRTLMFCMVSPLKENTKETINSLKFAENAQKVKQQSGPKGNGTKKATR